MASFSITIQFRLTIFGPHIHHGQYISAGDVSVTLASISLSTDFIKFMSSFHDYLFIYLLTLNEANIYRTRGKHANHYATDAFI